MKKSNLLILIGIVALAAIVVFKLVSNKRIIESGKVTIDRSHIPVSVNVVKAEVMELTTIIVRPAVIQPNEHANIAPQMPGKIESLNVELGTVVTKGQIIGKVDTKTYDIQLENLELAAKKYATDFKRNKELYEGNALSESQYLDSKYGMEAKELEAAHLREQISQSNIKSPLSGIITNKLQVAGEFIGAGTPVAIVQDVNTLKINVFVNESEVRFIHKNDDAIIRSAIYPGKTFTGKITYVAPSGDQNFNYLIEIKMDAKNNSELKAGAYVNVHFNVDSKGEMVLQIPKRALVEGVKNPYVFVKSGDRAVKREVHIGRENGEFIEIIDGLKAGEEVVTDGQINIVDQSLIQSK